LRHSIAPYGTFGSLLLVLCVWGFYIGNRSGKWGLLESSLFLSGIYCLQVGMGLWYRISLKDGIISRRAFAEPRVSIPISDITSLDHPSPKLKAVVNFNTPFRRISIVGHVGGVRKLINVSTKHFLSEDIRLLMLAIHEARPDLELPRT